uniref:Uncharacterized protein n=1 Tax=Panagrellus redivivus TaxID=6233 RepID=A0A7E4ZT33_PANRE
MSAIRGFESRERQMTVRPGCVSPELEGAPGAVGVPLLYGCISAIDLDPEEAKWLEAAQQEIDAQIESFDPVDEEKLAATEKAILAACRDPLSLSKPGFKSPFERVKRQRKTKNDAPENAENGKEQPETANAGVTTIFLADPVLEGLKFTDDARYAVKDAEWLESAKKHFVELSKLTSERRGRMVDPESLFHPSRANDNPSFWHTASKKAT